MRFLVYYFNGLVVTNIMIIADDETDAMQQVDEELRDENSDFSRNHCFADSCYIVSCEEMDK